VSHGFLTKEKAMGYRSDVAYAIQFKDADERATFRDVMLHKNDQHITQALEETQDYRDGFKDKYIVFKIEDVKWYKGYKDVDAHHALLIEAEDLFEASYRFIAIGEDGQETYEEGGEEQDTLSYMLGTRHEIVTTF
jgi:predicted nuclease of restriction endonuclease-like RecB superfamily